MTAPGSTIPLRLTYEADYLLRAAAHLEPHNPARHILIPDGSPLTPHARTLQGDGYIVKEADGLTGTWYRLTAKGLAYRPVPRG